MGCDRKQRVSGEEAEAEVKGRIENVALERRKKIATEEKSLNQREPVHLPQTPTQQQQQPDRDGLLHRVTLHVSSPVTRAKKLSNQKGWRERERNFFRDLFCRRFFPPELTVRGRERPGKPGQKKSRRSGFMELNAYLTKVTKMQGGGM